MLLVREPKVRKASEVQKGHKELQVQPAQLEQQVLLALRVQQVLTALTVLTVLMEQQAHKDRKALQVLRVRKVTQD